MILKLFFGKDEDHVPTFRLPVDFINIAPPDSIVILLPEGIVNVTPDGIVNNELFWTITFDGDKKEFSRLQLEVIVQSPDSGVEQNADAVPTAR